MRLGVFARTFAAIGAPAVLAAARGAGYDCVQWNMACLGLASLPERIDAAVADEVAAASRDTGVALVAVSGTCNLVHPDPAARADGLARLAVLVQAAPHLGTTLVTLCTGSRDPLDPWRFHPDNAGPAAWRDLIAALEAVLPVAEAQGVDLGIEPELANVVSTPDRARDLIDTLRSPRLGIVLDAANLADAGGPDRRRAGLDRAVGLLGDRLRLAHAKDRRADGGVCRPGRGEIDFVHLVATLRRAGFDGALVAHGITPGEAPNVAAFLRPILDRGTPI